MDKYRLVTTFVFLTSIR